MAVPVDGDDAENVIVLGNALEGVALDVARVARVVVTPSPEQLAKIRLEKRMIGLENRATAGQQAGSRHTAATGAL